MIEFIDIWLPCMRVFWSLSAAAQSAELCLRLLSLAKLHQYASVSHIRHINQPYLQRTRIDRGWQMLNRSIEINENMFMKKYCFSCHVQGHKPMVGPQRSLPNIRIWSRSFWISSGEGDNERQEQIFCYQCKLVSRAFMTLEKKACNHSAKWIGCKQEFRGSLFGPSCYVWGSYEPRFWLPDFLKVKWSVYWENIES